MFSPRILLVDDDLVFAGIIEQTAKIAEISIQYLSTTAVLSEQLLSEIDVLICDFELPTLTGIQVSKAMHLRHPEVPVILVSSYKSPLGKYNLPKNHSFIPKGLGPQFILANAITAYQNQRDTS